MSSYPESVESVDAASVRAIAQIAGNVQGVGFRPFLYRLANEHGLRGKVANSATGVDVEIEGKAADVKAFLADIDRRSPTLANITEVNHRFTDAVGYPAFVIVGSTGEGPRTAQISPDVAVCDDCLDELFDASDRRYRYPLINCTNCGPRYTIIADVPYDRHATAMRCFAMCSACQAEYEEPTNRRFHAQPNACPECGPRVWLEPGQTSLRQPSVDPIREAANLLQQGAIVAVKGLGGFHLACDATNAHAVQALRQRKRRDEKPFAVMVPDLETARQFCHLDEAAEAIITSCERPITLLRRNDDAPVADAVAPSSHRLGLMLPYTPLHYLLLFDDSRRSRFQALVMTSGNLSDEPIAIGNREAVHRLGQVADAFLLHDRDILVRADDSVVLHNAGSSDDSTIIRRSRGYVPAPVFLHRDMGEVLAVGGHLKNTIAISRGSAVFLSQHIGDLDTLPTSNFFSETVDHLQRILGVQPSVVAHDLHPDYLSTRFAQRLGDAQLVPVQHHHAHVAACMAEHGLDGPVIGVALDGSGYGTDGRVWGGEILIADYHDFQRAAHFRYVPLPGNEQAIKQPWRMALSYLDAAFGDDMWNLPIPFIRDLDRPSVELLLRATRQGINSPQTSSCGRLFDAVAAIAGLRQAVSYEGQAAIELEATCALEHVTSQAADRVDDGPPEWEAPPSNLGCQTLVLDTTSLIRDVVTDVRAGLPPAVVSFRFHQALVEMITTAIVQVASATGLRHVVLSGGCFQNQVLQNRLTRALTAEELLVFSHRLVPPNDSGLALGQLVVAAAATRGLPSR